MAEISFDFSHLHTILLDEIYQFFQNRSFTDVQISVQKCTIDCHQVILAANSPVLAAMLSSGMKESQTRSINLDSFSPSAMKAIIDYMYTGKISVKEDDLAEAIQACDFLQISKPLDKLTKYVIDHLDATNVLLWYQFSSCRHMEDMKVCCKRIMYLAFEDVTESDEFLELTNDEMMEFVGHYDDYSISHDAALTACVKWMQAHSQHTQIFDEIKLEQCSYDMLDSVIHRCGGHLHANMQDKLIEAQNKVASHKQEPTSGKALAFVTQKSCCIHNKKKKLVVLADLQYEKQSRYNEGIYEIPFNHNYDLCEIPGGFIRVEDNMDFNKDKQEFALRLIRFSFTSRSTENLPGKLLETRHVRNAINKERTVVICHGGLIYLFGLDKDVCRTYNIDSTTLEDWKEGPKVPCCDASSWGAATWKDRLFLLADNGKLFELVNGQFEERASLKIGFYNFQLTTHQGNIYVISLDMLSMKVYWYSIYVDQWRTLLENSFTQRIEEKDSKCVLIDQKVYLMTRSGYTNQWRLLEFCLLSNQILASSMKVPQGVKKCWLTVMDVPERGVDGEDTLKPYKVVYETDSEQEPEEEMEEDSSDYGTSRHGERWGMWGCDYECDDDDSDDDGY